MSSENEDQCFTGSAVESKSAPKPTRISYTRDFLLSFSDLDICKKLPAGFDTSVLSEFEDTSHNVSEWQRVQGGLSSQSSKRSEYGTSPPNNYSRGSQGRWDTRSSVSNDRDGDFQSDRESDTGRRYGNQSRRSWQIPEHDGLLGSGAFPRPSGYSTGGSIPPRGRGNGHYPLNRSSEPYQPPRPYKAMPHVRRENTDMLNDETFGSSECSSEDRAEEERKRRASFELMRKEQHKALQEKQKQGTEKHKDQIGVLLESSEPEEISWNCNLNKSEDSHVEHVFDDEFIKCSLPAQAPSARPLIPPGFTSTKLENNVGTKLLAPFPVSEVGHSEVEDYSSQTKSVWMTKDLCDNQDNRKSSTTCEVTSEKNVLPSLDVEVADYSIPIENPQGNNVEGNDISNQREASIVWPDGPITDLGAEKLATGVSMLAPEEGTSVLQKLFDSALTLNGVGSLTSAEPAVILDEDPWNPVSSSKFAHWFLDEEPVIADDQSSSKSRELLSLISEKGRHQVSEASDETAVEHLPPSMLFEKAHVSQATVKPQKCVTPEANLTVLTCEDLEQVIMAEANESGNRNLVEGGPWDVSDTEIGPPKVEVDNHASQHLLSLLQKGVGLKELTPSLSFDVHTTDSKGSDLDKVKEIHSAEKTLTLETLFGSAFMKELQSVGAPVSAQRGTTAIVDDCGHGKVNPQTNLTGSNHTHAKSDVFQGDLLGFDNPRADSSNLSMVGFEERVDGPMELQLPEEESLISMGRDAVQLVKSQTQDSLSSKAPVEIVDKLATLNAIMKGERSMLPGMDSGPVFRDAHEPVNPEFPFQLSHGRPSSPPFSHHQINHHNTRPFFQTVDQHTHRNSQMIGAENIPHQDFGHFSSNAFHHPHSFNGPGGPRFDPHHHPVMPHIRSLQGNFPPPHMLQGLPRGVPLSPPINNMCGYMTQDLSPLQGFAPSHRQPNFTGSGTMAPGQMSHPEARERLEMDLRANTKQQIFPAGAGQAPGMYVPPELDMGFRYR